MLKAINLKETKDFDIEGTIFLIGVIKNSDMMPFIQSASTKEGGSVNLTVDEMMRIFSLGIKGIKNVEINGEIKNLDEKEISKDTFDLFDLNIASKVVTKIIELNIPQEKELKN